MFRVVCKKMKIDKMADARIFIKGSLVCRDRVAFRNLRANVLFAGTERAKHRGTRHDVEDEGWGGSTAGSFCG